MISERWQQIEKVYHSALNRLSLMVIFVTDHGFNAALHAPDKIKAIVAIEGSGTPDFAQADLKNLLNIPHLLYG